MGRIKGAAIRAFLEWYRAEFGDIDLINRMRGVRLGSLISFDPTATGCGVLASGWYAAEDVHAILGAIVGDRDEASVAELVDTGVRRSLSQTLTGLHRALVRVVATPSLHARFSQKLWSTYYDTGVVESVCIAEDVQSVSYLGWTSHHPILCAMTAASDAVIFPMMGLSNVRVRRTACVDQGASECTHIVRWDC